MNTAYEWVIPLFEEFISFLVNVLNSTWMLKKVFTPDKGYCRYRDRNNCGIISHSVAERWLNFSRSMWCFLLTPTTPAIPQIFQIKTLYHSFVTTNYIHLCRWNIQLAFFPLRVFLMQPYVSKARPKRTEGCSTVSFKYIYLLQLSVLLIIGSLIIKYGDYGRRLRFNMLCLCEFLYRICWMNVM